MLSQADYIDIALLSYGAALPVEPYVVYGRIGVILFFAISGFVIALQRQKAVGVFIVHRLLRIYPSYWIALLTAALAFYLIGRPVAGLGPAPILLFPTATASDAFAIPYWTLVFEMVFYALAAVAFGIRLSGRTRRFCPWHGSLRSICSDRTRRIRWNTRFRGQQYFCLPQFRFFRWD